MTASSCSALDTPAKMMSERHFYDQLPQYALIEIEPHLRFNYEQKSWAGALEYGFVFDDLIEDCLARTIVKENAEEELEGWFDEMCEHLVAEDWFHNASLEYLNCIGMLFTYLREQIQPLYTPSGYHYYEFTEWFDKHTLLLSKRRFVE